MWEAWWQYRVGDMDADTLVREHMPDFIELLEEVDDMILAEYMSAKAESAEQEEDTAEQG
jgi:hypothetical protein